MITYILIGVFFMFCVEYIINSGTFKKTLKLNKTNFPIGWKERIVGIFMWPLFVVIFLYNFFKELFK